MAWSIPQHIAEAKRERIKDMFRYWADKATPFTDHPSYLECKVPSTAIRDMYSLSGFNNSPYGVHETNATYANRDYNFNNWIDGTAVIWSGSKKCTATVTFSQEPTSTSYLSDSYRCMTLYKNAEKSTGNLNMMGIPAIPNFSNTAVRTIAVDYTARTVVVIRNAEPRVTFLQFNGVDAGSRILTAAKYLYSVTHTVNSTEMTDNELTSILGVCLSGDGKRCFITCGDGRPVIMFQKGTKTNTWAVVDSNAMNLPINKSKYLTLSGGIKTDYKGKTLVICGGSSSVIAPLYYIFRELHGKFEHVGPYNVTSQLSSLLGATSIPDEGMRNQLENRSVMEISNDGNKICLVANNFLLKLVYDPINNQFAVTSRLRQNYAGLEGYKWGTNAYDRLRIMWAVSNDFDYIVRCYVYTTDLTMGSSKYSLIQYTIVPLQDTKVDGTTMTTLGYSRVGKIESSLNSYAQHRILFVQFSRNMKQLRVGFWQSGTPRSISGTGEVYKATYLDLGFGNKF